MRSIPAARAPALSGQLQIDKLDLNPYLPPETAPGATTPAAGAAAPGKTAAPAPAAAGWSDAPIDLSALRAADADFALSAGAILYRKIVIGPSALALHLKGGKLTADLSQLSLYQGKGSGKVALDGSGAVPAMAMTFNLAGLEIEPLLQAAADTDRLQRHGQACASTSPAAARASARSSRTLDGKGALDLANGEIKGVNLIALAENPTAA